MVQRCMPQLCSGPGSFAVGVDVYSVAPKAIFASLAPPSLDPELAHYCYSLSLFRRLALE